MPIRPPSLDDLTFDTLVDEVLARIPAHSPEYTNPRLGDPGRTLIELFAWLTDSLLYRANLIPERQRLAFLRLLGQPMRPAQAARGLVSVFIDDDSVTTARTIRPLAKLEGPVDFETRDELTILPVTGAAYIKRVLTEEEEGPAAKLVDGLREIYQLLPSEQPVPYVTTPVFAAGTDPTGLDLVEKAVDHMLWFALLAADAEQVEAVRTTLGGGDSPRAPVLSVGVAPSLAVPELFEQIGPRGRIRHVWEISTSGAEGLPRYVTADVVADTSDSLTRQGVLKLRMPDEAFIGAPSNDVRENLDAGIGDSPPRIDDPEQAARLVAWLRLRSTEDDLQRLSLSWAGINAVEIDQRETIIGRTAGQSDGSADQEIPLPGQSVEAETLRIEVEEAGRGYRPWTAIDELPTAGRDSSVFQLDSEAGTLRFGDGVRGRIPDAGSRVRIALMRHGGGAQGNLPAGSLAEIDAFSVEGPRVAVKLRVEQPLKTEGGVAAETLEQAEARIPAMLRRRERAVTADDYRTLAAETPGVRLGRVEVMPRFRPHQRLFDLPGVISVMALPQKETRQTPNPRPDRPLIEAVHGYLDPRRPLATEMYVIGPEYIPLAVSVGITLREGFDREATFIAVRDALRSFLWPLVPGGHEATGWPLGRSVRDRELEGAVARTAGVREVHGVNLFEIRDGEWRVVTRSDCAATEIALDEWQLPELMGVLVEEGSPTDDPADFLTATPADRGEGGIAIPIVPEVC